MKFGDCLDFTTLFTCAKSKHFEAKVFNCFKYKAKSCDECNGPSLVLVSWKFSEGERKSEWKTRGNSIFLVFQLFPFLKLNSPGRCFASTSEIRQFINLSFRCVSLFRNWNVRAANSFRISFEDGLKRRFSLGNASFQIIIACSTKRAIVYSPLMKSFQIFSLWFFSVRDIKVEKTLDKLALSIAINLFN